MFLAKMLMKIEKRSFLFILLLESVLIGFVRARSAIKKPRDVEPTVGQGFFACRDGCLSKVRAYERFIKSPLFNG